MIDFFDISGFALHQYAWLALGGVLFSLSIWFHLIKKQKLAILFLTFAAFAIFIFGALLDPFLNVWDERIHALVAKNTIPNFLEPKLFNHPYVAECNYINWTSAHIWLHKQPLFIWQMALSMKIFGVNEFAVRLPSVILATLSVPIGYRIGRLLLNRNIGYYTAIAISCSWFLLNLVSGVEKIEHNDVSFFFYVTASIWAFIEYIHNQRSIKWIILIGLFAGCAVLTKWLTGLLIFFIWGVYLLATYKFNFKEWRIKHILIALFVTTLIFLPWQIFILKNYPEPALIEYQYNSKHLFEQIENQNTDLFFHFSRIPYLFIGYKYLYSEGTIFMRGLNITLNAIILVFGLLRLIFLIKKREQRITLIATILFVYLFFSLATTKMPAYTFLIGIIWFMSLGVMIDFLIQKIQILVKNRVLSKVFQGVIILLIGFYMLNFTRIRNLHTDECWWRKDMITNKETFLRVKDKIPENGIVFNLRGNGKYNFDMQYVEASFYLNRDCYPLPPSEKTIQDLKKLGFIPVYFSDHPLPDYILNDPDAIFIHEEIYNDL